jgi:hypothetical protein
MNDVQTPHSIPRNPLRTRTSTIRFGTRTPSSTSSTSSRSSTRTTTASAISGIDSKLGYIRDLGVNTIWLMPFYPSPLKDDGYDIADYRTCTRSTAPRRFSHHAARGASAGI